MSLKLETAEKIVKGAIARAQEMGIRVSVAVLDDGGNLVYVARMDGAPFMSPQIAMGKAFASAAFRKSSAQLQQDAPTRPLFFSSFSDVSQGRAIIGQGALPIVIDGAVVGAAGASGGTSVEDEEIVKAGLATLG